MHAWAIESRRLRPKTDWRRFDVYMSRATARRVMTYQKKWFPECEYRIRKYISE